MVARGNERATGPRSSTDGQVGFALFERIPHALSVADFQGNAGFAMTGPEGCEEARYHVFAGGGDRGQAQLAPLGVERLGGGRLAHLEQGQDLAGVAGEHFARGCDDQPRPALSTSGTPSSRSIDPTAAETAGRLPAGLGRLRSRSRPRHLHEGAELIEGHRATLS